MKMALGDMIGKMDMTVRYLLQAGHATALMHKGSHGMIFDSLTGCCTVIYEIQTFMT